MESAISDSKPNIKKKPATANSGLPYNNTKINICMTTNLTKVFFNAAFLL